MLRPDRNSALAALRYVTTLVASARHAHPQRMCHGFPWTLFKPSSLVIGTDSATNSRWFLEIRITPENRRAPLHMALRPHFFDWHAESTIHPPRDQPRRPRPALSDRRPSGRVRGGPVRLP